MKDERYSPIRFRSEHYDFHYVPGSLAEKDVREIARIQEDCYREITRLLRVEPDFRLHYVLCETPREVGEAYGDGVACNGFAHAPDTVYAVYNDRVKCIGMHEDTHLISFLRGRPNHALLREGLAMYMDRVWWKRPNEDWCREFLEKGTLLPIEALLDDRYFYDHSEEITYPQAGAFTRFLMERLTPGGYLDNVYYAPDPKEAMARETGLNFSEIDDAFIQYLRNPA